MAMLWQTLSATPSENGNRPSPTGAPEGTFTIGQVNDTLRWLMAAVRELGDQVVSNAATLGTMAAQAANAVAITGGTIKGCSLDNTNAIAGDAITSGTIPAGRFPVGTVFNAQVAYDLAWPVGSQRLWNSTTLTGLVPVGVSATWSRIAAAQDALLAGAGTINSYGVHGSGSDIVVGAAGAHDHGGTTGGTTLTLAQVPAGIVTDWTTANHTSRPDSAPFGTDQDFITTKNTGGGQAHGHGIAAAPTHTHTATLPKVFATVLVERIA
jgi:hypothetical protein